MKSSVGRFENWHQWQCVAYGVDALGELAEEVKRSGAQRLMLFTTPSLVRQAEVVEAVSRQLGTSLVATFGECRQYVPRQTVFAATALARTERADLLISLGGGSVVDTAKGVALALAGSLERPEELDPFRLAPLGDARELSGNPVSIYALPTTLSGAEYTGMVGITNEATGYREPFRDDRLSPRTVILDPFITRATPTRLWAATGMKALSDAFEQYSSGHAGPVMEALTLRAVEWLMRRLPGSVDGDDAARLDCQVASWLTLFGTFNAQTKVGIGAAIRHQLGMLHAIPHGEATCAVLSEVVRATAPTEPAALEPLARAAGVDPSVQEADRHSALAARIRGLICELGLPTSLQEIGVARASLPELAKRTAADFAARSRSAKRWRPDEIERLLERSLS